MVMKRHFFNILLSGIFLAYPAFAGESLTPVNFKGVYEFALSGVRFGKMGIEAEQSPDHYAMTCDIATTGLLKLFVQHSSHTTVDGAGQDFLYPDSIYETRYQTKKKAKYVKMVRQGGALIEEKLVPPETFETRPRVPAELKNDAVDPLSFLPMMRRELWAAAQQGKNAFSLNAYDGRRLTQVNFAIEGKKTIFHRGAEQPVIVVTARRKQITGFTDSEIRDFNPKEPLLYIYVSDDARLLPLKLEARLWMSPVTATLVKECRTGESCLLGIQ